MSRWISGLFVFLCLCTTVNAQKKWAEVGIQGGVSYYLGDLNWSQHFYNPKLSIGGFYKHHINSRALLKFGAMYNQLAANDADSRFIYQNIRDKVFEAEVTEVAVQAEFNFLDYHVKSIEKKRFTPYLDLGVGFLMLAGSQERFDFSIPMAVGIKYNIAPRWIFSVEWGFRKTFTDVLDNVTGEDLDIYKDSYVPYDLSNRYTQFGFNTNDDWYSYATVSISYAFRLGSFVCQAYH